MPDESSSSEVIAVTVVYASSESMFNVKPPKPAVRLTGVPAERGREDAVVADAGEPLSPQAADLFRWIARVLLDQPPT